MRILMPAILSGFLLITGCAVQTVQQTAAQPRECDAKSAQFAVGRAYTPELAEQARTAAGAKVVRVIEPGQAVTMDFRTDRLNLELDATRKVITVRCG